MNLVKNLTYLDLEWIRYEEIELPLLTIKTCYMILNLSLVNKLGISMELE